MSSDAPRVTVVIPAYNEDEQIIPILDRLFESVRLPCEVLVIVDSETDTTIPVVEEYAQKENRLRSLVSTYARGPANAIRFGIDRASAPVVVVTMADGSDDSEQIDTLCKLVERGVDASDVDVQPWGSFVTFADPDGNTWALQQLPAR